MKNPRCWFWLSFSHPRRGFFGGCVVKGFHAQQALARAASIGIPDSTQVLGVVAVGPVAWEDFLVEYPIDELLSEDQIKQLDPGCRKIV